jgi:hypothetical protein
MKSQYVRITQGLVCALAVLASVTTAHASVPPTEPPPVDTGGVDPTDPNAVELVQSWAMGPSADDFGARTELTYDVAPGDVVEDSVTIYNFGNLQMTLELYSADAFTDEDGTFSLQERVTPPTDSGSWIQFGQQAVTVPPGKQVTIPITITVPVEAAAGDHAAGLLAANTSETTDDSGKIIKLERRTGTRAYFRVAGELTPDMTVTDVTASYEQALSPLSGSAEVQFVVENRGNVRLSATPVVSISGPFGVGKKQVELDPLNNFLPGQTVTLTATVDGAPAFFLDRAEVKLVPIDPVAGQGTESGRDTVFAPPVAALLIILALCLATLAYRAYRRRNPPSPSSTDETRVEVRELQNS